MSDEDYSNHKTNPMKAIRAKCIDCCAGNMAEVKICHITACDLHPYRMGKNPFRTKRVLTDEQKAQMAERLANSRATKQETANESD